MSTKHLSLNPQATQAPTRDLPTGATVPDQLPTAKETKVHPSGNEKKNASIYFVGTATVILEWEGIRVMTDPNFLLSGDEVHLGPGVNTVRLTEPAVHLHRLPKIDLVLLSHYHGDHFDYKVEASLRRDLPIITTPHAQSRLTSKGPQDSFTRVFALDVFQQMMVSIGSAGQKQPRIRVTAMPGQHVPNTKPLQKLNELIQAIPPTNGWMVELGYSASDEDFTAGYRIYISGDTLMVDDLKQIPQRYADQRIDLMLMHLGGTTIPSPAMSPVTMMVTMDATQGRELMQLLQPDITIPIHYDDYDVFASPLADFKETVGRAGLESRVVYLDRGEQYQFGVRD